jgi:hypothetical protein
LFIDRSSKDMISPLDSEQTQQNKWIDSRRTTQSKERIKETIEIYFDKILHYLETPHTLYINKT